MILEVHLVDVALMYQKRVDCDAEVDLNLHVGLVSVSALIISVRMFVDRSRPQTKDTNMNEHKRV